MTVVLMTLLTWLVVLVSFVVLKARQPRLDYPVPPRRGAPDSRYYDAA